MSRAVWRVSKNISRKKSRHANLWDEYEKFGFFIMCETGYIERGQTKWRRKIFRRLKQKPWDQKQNLGLEWSELCLSRPRLLWRHSLGSPRNLRPPRFSAEAKGTLLSLCFSCPDHGFGLCQKIWAGDRVKITLEQIGASLLCDKKQIINRTGSSQRQRFKVKRFSSTVWIQFALVDLRALHCFHSEINYSISKRI